MAEAAPAREARLAAIRLIADQEDVNVPDDVAKYLADAVDDTRTLKAVVIRLIAFASLMGQPIALDIAMDVLSTAAERDVH